MSVRCFDQPASWLGMKIVAAQIRVQRFRSRLGGSAASVKIRIVFSFFQVSGVFKCSLCTPLFPPVTEAFELAEGVGYVKLLALSWVRSTQAQERWSGLVFVFVWMRASPCVLSCA
jgi:hypothetical protein